MATEPNVDPYLELRLEMVGRQLRQRGIEDERVLRAMSVVPRHEFIPPQLRPNAYEDAPVAIGNGQTVSQPYIVAFMLQALEIDPDHRVLEIGTGTGYEAALLAELTQEVFSVERIPALAEAARQNLTRLGYTNVKVVEGDGTQGLPGEAPFDRIVVAAAGPKIPPALVEQLAERGRMVIPVGTAEQQELLLVRKQYGEVTTQRLEGCRFVPLIGEHGFSGS